MIMQHRQYIFLKDLHIYAHHGVAPQETVVGNDFIINLRVETDFTHALQTDELKGTVSYADLVASIQEEMDKPSKLLEHVGGRIVERLFHDFPSIKSIDLTLGKRNPPMGADIDMAGIELHSQRN